MERMQEYFRALKREFEKLYSIASEARRRGIDPEPYVEIKPAEDLADRIEALLGIQGLSSLVRKHVEKYGKELGAFKVAEEIISRFRKEMDRERVAELAIRAALAVLTDGITAAPLQGVSHVRIKRNDDGSEYLAIYYAGPIRSAGGTEQALSVLVGDYIRRLLGLASYKPSSKEVERFLEELRTYEKYVGRFQYHATDDEVRLAYSNLPVEVTGVATDPVEVTIHRDLPRIETNKVRGGALRVVNDGIISKARKLIPIIEKLNIGGWDWLRELVHEERKEVGIEPSEKYLADIVAGRPVFSHPSAKFGFRIRYGRSRNTGLAAIGIHPATMVLLGGFLAVGTQVRTERPGKSAVVLPVDSIEGPIVKLKDGSVVRVETLEEAYQLRDKVAEIIFAGDILVAYGEFKENNYPLVPSGYTEEWWALEVKEALEDATRRGRKIPEDLRKMLFKILQNPVKAAPSAKDALKISMTLDVPLHPRYTYFWRNVKIKELIRLSDELRRNSKLKVDRDGFVEKIKVKLSAESKRVLELLGIPHRVVDGYVVIEEHAPIVGRIFLNPLKIPVEDVKDSLEFVRRISGLKIQDKMPLGTGLRMGRPEKASPRKMNPPVQVLFPVGETDSRDLMKIAKERGKIKAEVANLKCPYCGRMLLEYRCPKCNARAVLVKKCPKCGEEIKGEICRNCKVKGLVFGLRDVNLESYLRELSRRYGVELPRTIRGVRKLMNSDRKPEPLIKGILRARYGLYVFKDGTVRFDATNAPLTHFKPCEIGVTIDKLRELGYTEDYKGAPLKDENQIVELKVQDVILPREAGVYLLRVANFIDELLSKVYGIEPYYKARKVEDLIGHLVIGLAPHTSAGILGRIIGFTDANVIYAHPFWHAAKRRNCDGDEDSVMLALDALLNFSRHYLPSQIGGMMDAPLILTVTLKVEEVDDEVFNMDVHWGYPIKFYLSTLRGAGPREVRRLVEIVEDRLGSERAYVNLGFTHDTSNINAGPKNTAYRLLRNMSEKIRAQLMLASLMLAVDERDVAERLLAHHLIPDVVGNLRAFGTQKFRCVKCGRVFRRIPLLGRCPYCSGRIVLTVHRGSVEKYASFLDEIADRYDVRKYLKQRVMLINAMLKVAFGKGKEESLDNYLED